MSDFRAPPRKKNAADNRKLALSAPCPSAQGKMSSLTWQFTGNNPRLVVWTGDPEDSGQQNNYGKIVAKLDPFIFSIIIKTVKKVIATEGETKLKIDCEDFTFYGGKRSERPEVTASIIVQKNSAGVIAIMVVDAKKQQRPKIPFKLMPPRFCKLVGADGNVLADGEASKIAAEAYVDMLELVMANLVVSEYVEPPPKDQQGGGNRGGGGGYNRGGNGGGYNGGGNSGGGGGSSSPDDEIPF